MNADQTETKTRSALDKAFDWGFMVAAGLSAFNLPVDIIKYREGEAGLLPIIGGTTMVLAYGAHKWMQWSAKSDAINAVRADVSAARIAREDEVEGLEARLSRKPENKNSLKP
jgi:hypothetical protein